VLQRAIGAEATLVTVDSLCRRALAALDSTFSLESKTDSIYLFADRGNYFASIRPFRVQIDVTLVQYDSAFVERGRRIVRIP